MMNKSEKEQLAGPEGLTQREMEIIENNFTAHPLDTDVGNALFSASMFVAAGNFEAIAKFQTYEEYVREVAAKHSNPEAYCSAIMKRSNPTLVKEYDARILMFNEKLEEIKRKRDGKGIEDFIQEMITFLKTGR